MKKEKKNVSVGLSVDVCDKIDALAKSTYRTRAGYIRQIIRVYLQNLEENRVSDAWWVIK